MSTLQPYNFFFELPLYASIEINSENSKEFHTLISTNYTIEAYNPSLKQETTYTVTKDRGYGTMRSVDLFQHTGFHEFELKCVRNKYEIKVFANFFYVDIEHDRKYFLEKVGQYPSIADMHISKLKDYDRVLGKEKIKEITRAMGLAANGVGIGSFVYLRRVFEFLIEEAHQSAIKDTGWDEDLFQKSKVIERIAQLKMHLPEFLVRNKSIYGILSVGIHSLNENECLKYFETIKVAIELILDEKVEKLSKAQKIKNAENKIQAITNMLNKK